MPVFTQSINATSQARYGFGERPLNFLDPDGFESVDAAYSWNEYFSDAPKVQLPVKNSRITSKAGPRKVLNTPAGKSSPVHKGWDFAPEKGKTTQSYKSIADGTIVKIGKTDSVGNYTAINHDNGWMSLYYHDDLPSLYSEGDKVTQDTTIGSMGNSGISTATHMHLEIRKNNTPIDPAILYEKEKVMYGEAKSRCKD